jgi:tRNA-Thr(GGU) m(6)t(6)A37 methyltransferase TsaA
MTPPPRTRQQRTLDALNRLDHDVDVWIATADEDGGAPYLIPLSFLWDGSTLLVATPAASPTGRNLRATGRVRLGIGPSRDVVLIDGTAQALAAAELPDEIGDAFAVKTGFDPRQDSNLFVYFRIRPLRVQAWREANELRGRDLMRDGHWIDGSPDGPDGLDGDSNSVLSKLSEPRYQLRPVGRVESPLTDRHTAPKQGDEGAPLARVVFGPDLREAAADLRVGDRVLVLTWLHQGQRDVLSVHPRGAKNRASTGVFSTRSPDRPNPIGLHTVTIEAVEDNAITVRGLEAIDGTPVLDVKPVLRPVDQR